VESVRHNIHYNLREGRGLDVEFDMRKMNSVSPRVHNAQPNCRSELPLSSALSADQIAFWKWQEHAVYSRIVFGAVQELGLEAG
jgi:hypothetical protein